MPLTASRAPMISLADEAKDIGTILIAKYHPHLADANILYLFTDQKRKKCDRVKIGSAAKMNAIQRFLASNMESVESGPDFIMLLDFVRWPGFNEAQQRALVDHELCHMCVMGKTGNSWRRLRNDDSKDDFEEWSYGLRGHDIEEFHEVLERHGAWKADEEEAHVISAIRQLPLPMNTLHEVGKH